MVNIDKIEKNTKLWLVSQSIEEMIYPTQVSFNRKESNKSNKLSMVKFNNKIFCCPTHLLFNSKKEALAYASINFLKLYYEFDPFMTSENISEKTLQDAHTLVEKIETEDPALYLYYWMGNVPNKF